MAASGWKGAIAFGPLIRFNVRATAVDKAVTFAFNQHHADCGGRVRARPGVCEGCGTVLEDKSQIVRGYKGAWPIDEAYLDSLEVEKSSVMELDAMVPAEQIEPRWYQREYDVVPEAGAEQPYALFTKLLERAGKVAIGKVVSGGKEAIVAVRPRDGVLAMDLMWWPDELKANNDAKAMVAGVEIAEPMLKMGDQLVAMMSKDFEPGQYVNEYAASLEAYLSQLMAGTAPTPIVHKAAPTTVSASLEEQMAATLAALGGQPKAAEKKSRKRAA